MVPTVLAIGLATVSLVGAVRARGGDARSGRLGSAAMGAAVALAVLARAPRLGVNNDSDFVLGWNLLVAGGVLGPVLAALLVRSTRRPALAAAPLALGTLLAGFGGFVAYVVWADAQPLGDDIVLEPVAPE
jgi:drug/metabolite transporter (DMT)-like permease